MALTTKKFEVRVIVKELVVDETGFVYGSDTTFEAPLWSGQDKEKTLAEVAGLASGEW